MTDLKNIVLGIDPGMNSTGFGAIDLGNGLLQLIDAGQIRPPKDKPLSQRLQYLYRALGQVVSHQRPGAVVLEKLYTHYEHVTTAATMAHARGIACLVAEQHGVPVFEYAPNRIKKAVTGHGTASKDQVARMVAQRLKCCDPSWSYDATDALALAIGHAQMASSRAVAGATR